MKFKMITAGAFALGIGMAMSACGGAANSSNASNGNAAKPSNSTNSSSTSSSSNSAANSAPVAKQGTPPKADMTMTPADLHKDYKTLGDKDPKSIGEKYEGKKIQLTGTISRVYPTTTGTGTNTDVSFKGASSNEDDASCSVMPQTEESMALKVGDVVTMVGTQTHNMNGTTPRLENCYVIKVGQ